MDFNIVKKTKPHPVQKFLIQLKIRFFSRQKINFLLSNNKNVVPSKKKNDFLPVDFATKNLFSLQNSRLRQKNKSISSRPENPDFVGKFGFNRLKISGFFRTNKISTFLDYSRSSHSSRCEYETRSLAPRPIERHFGAFTRQKPIKTTIIFDSRMRR